jgi:hypothetical protein
VARSHLVVEAHVEVVDTQFRLRKVVPKVGRLPEPLERLLRIGGAALPRRRQNGPSPKRRTSPPDACTLPSRSSKPTWHMESSLPRCAASRCQA